MSEKNYKKMKVFDCNWDPGMSEDVKNAFFRLFDHVMSNGVFVEYSIHDENFSKKDENCQQALDKKLLDSWLVENGAKSPKSEDEEGETVLIKHWW